MCSPLHCTCRSCIADSGVIEGGLQLVLYIPASPRKRHDDNSTVSIGYELLIAYSRSAVFRVGVDVIIQKNAGGDNKYHVLNTLSSSKNNSLPARISRGIQRIQHLGGVYCTILVLDNSQQNKNRRVVNTSGTSCLS